ncbi:MAG: HlyD family type I secretion periplasmic adaptor subunit, partial [Roseibium sp.]|nr:HlyD family type I secretion periplasmic adaptor subunit [Roseibium sp.]
MARVNEDFANDVRRALDARRTVRYWPLLLILLLALAGLGYWAQIAELEEMTTGEGRVIPSSQVKVVESLEGGLVAEIFVQEGDIVDAGEPLVRIDDTGFASTLGELDKQRAALLAKAERLNAEAYGQPLVLTETPSGDGLVARETALFDARRSALEQELLVIDQQLSQRRLEKTELETRLVSTVQSMALLDEEVRRARDLSKAGAFPQMDLLRLEREAQNMNLDVAVLEASIPRAKAAIDEAVARRTSAELGFQAKAHQDLTLTLNELTVLDESIKSAKDKVRRTTLRAPVRGIINSFPVATIGAVVAPGEGIAEIVPLDDTLLIETRIRPQDVAFLSPGQSARVKVTAYDYTVYGDLAGLVERISADTITDEAGDRFYRIIVRTDKNHLGSESDYLPIIPGMVVSTSILTGKKTVLDYLL